MGQREFSVATMSSMTKATGKKGKNNNKRKRKGSSDNAASVSFFSISN